MSTPESGSSESGSSESKKADTGDAGDGPDEASPLERLGLLAMQTVAIDESPEGRLDHLELYTTQGLLTILWHGEADVDRVVVCVGGAMGGLLGPDGGVYHRLGRSLLEHGIGLLRLSYRRPNDLDLCLHDTLAVMELAARHGCRQFIPVGHSFGGAVAIQAASFFDRSSVPGVVTLATQSAGCEVAEELADRELLFVHGTADTILPHYSSEMVRMLAGTGELLLLEGADHLLKPAGDEVLAKLVATIPGWFSS